ncbi:hypothetical protein DFQ28_000496 [Apophysomyces sp. BC1034]|nr:hypothetical protein DFQ29_009168 [Apophysomyces sp. BC1021]KAG0183912.1 hypothetical protein DFQ28_000496 [Apophysomyces sp. BC1034]
MADDPWDDWETAADAGLLDYKQPHTPGKAVIDEDAENKKLWMEANQYATPVVIRTNSAQTEYKPEVITTTEIKILRRPKDTPEKPKINQPAPKTLQEREKEYTAAREKIFGKKTSS